jgi:transposase
VHVIDWPSYSSDLNPIEHLWIHLKRLVYTINPDIDNITGGEDNIRITLFKTLFRVWELIDKDILYDYIDSITTRFNAVIAAEG